MYSSDTFANADVIGKLTMSVDHLKEIYSDVLTWTSKTPKSTILRVNLLKSNRAEIEKTIIDGFREQKVSPMPNVYSLDSIPEIVVVDAVQSVVEPLLHAEEIYVDCSCASAVLRGANIYAPGVLSMTMNTKIGDTVNIFADLEKTILKGSKNPKPEQRLFIGIGIVLMQRYDLFGQYPQESGIAIQLKKTISGIPVLNETSFPVGHAMLQNLPSIICSRVLNPVSNEVILDMCAAPGNKTTHIAELMHDKGIIIALDRSFNKIEKLKAKLIAYGLKSVHCYTFDSTNAVILLRLMSHQLDSFELESSMFKPPFPQDSFDRILLDAPCSGTGIRPQLKCKNLAYNLLSYPKLQRKLFLAAVNLLKPNGVLVYSTCSVSHNENEDIVKWALDHFDNIELVPAEPLLGGPGLPGVGLSDDERLKVQRFGPTIDEDRKSSEIYRDSIGFFIAKFVKKS